jgi:hypothetical protein
MGDRADRRSAASLFEDLPMTPAHHTTNHWLARQRRARREALIMRLVLATIGAAIGAAALFSLLLNLHTMGIWQ